MSHLPPDAVYSELFARSPDMRCAVGSDGVIRAVNAAWERGIGRSAGELVGTALKDLIHPEDRSAAEAALQRAAAPTRVDCRVLRRGGGSMRVRFTAFAASEGDLLFASAEEIAEEDGSERRSRALVDAAPHFIGIAALNGQVLYINPAGLEITGRRGASLEDLRVAELWPPAYRQRLWKEILPALARDGFWSGDLPTLRPDGTEVPLSRMTTVLRDAAGRAEATATIAHDITAEVREAVELRKLTALAEGTSDLVGTALFDGRETYVNPAGMALLGRAGQDPASLRLRDVVPRHIKARFRDEIFPHVFEKNLWSGESELLRPDGSTLPVSQVVLLVRDDAGTPQGFGTIARDLRPAKALMRSLEDARSALSTPILEVYRDVLALPVVGHVDRDRAAHMSEALLHSIVRTRSRFAILDLTGVSDADPQTLEHLLSIASAAALLGSRCLISGVPREAAQMLSHAGLDLSRLPVFATLQEALRAAMRSLDGEGSDLGAGGALRRYP
jgi:PAS domain S-box-containing protein